jgi:16S rRNA processing protein RimM
VKLVRIGRISRAVGLHGMVGVAGTSGAVTALPRLALRRAGGEPVSYRVVAARSQGRLWAVQLEGVADRTASEALVGCEVLAAREDLGEAGEGLHWWADLDGLEVVTAQGEVVGRVTGLLETGAVDVLVVTGDRGETLIPLAPYVTVDREGGRIVVDAPEGLLDLEQVGRGEKGGPERGG